MAHGNADRHDNSVDASSSEREILDFYQRDGQHSPAIRLDGQDLAQGQRVEFDIVQGPPGPRAVHVKPL